MPETLGKIVLSYDVEDKQTQVKNALKELGYLDWWLRKSTNSRYSMPDTTVWHSSKRVSEAVNDLINVCEDLDVRVRTAFAVLEANEVAGYNA